MQTPVVWPASNIPQGWAQFGGYHYPGQARMPAPLALIAPYTPVSIELIHTLIVVFNKIQPLQMSKFFGLLFGANFLQRLLLEKS